MNSFIKEIKLVYLSHQENKYERLVEKSIKMMERDTVKKVDVLNLQLKKLDVLNNLIYGYSEIFENSTLEEDKTFASNRIEVFSMFRKKEIETAKHIIL